MKWYHIMSLDFDNQSFNSNPVLLKLSIKYKKKIVIKALKAIKLYIE